MKSSLNSKSAWKSQGSETQVFLGVSLLFLEPRERLFAVKNEIAKNNLLSKTL